MKRLLKKLAPTKPSAQIMNLSGLDIATGSADDLRLVIADLETVIAEHEATNAFLRDLLTQRWFETDTVASAEPAL